MAGSFSNPFEVDVLKALVGQATTLLTTTPITVYISLHTGSPGTDTAGTEVPATNGYARVSGASKFGTPASGAVANSSIVSFPQATGSWASGAALTHFAIFDASTSGNCLAWGDLQDQTKTMGNLDTISFAIGQLTITLD